MASETKPFYQICCGPDKICPQHPCKCVLCGPKRAKACAWRKTHREYLSRPTTKVKKTKFLKVMRIAKENPKLKAVETYFSMAARKGLQVDAIITSPSKRHVLHVLSQERLLMQPNTILDLSQSLGRNSIRDDGLVATLSCGCSHMFAPFFGDYLSAKQCMLLQGMRPTDFSIEVVSTVELFQLVGNAMNVVVVGTVLGAALMLVKGAP